jgi:phage terminase large subunit-like protein
VRLVYTWEGWNSRPSQHEPTGSWLYWLLKAGRGFGKTRIGAEWVRKQARHVPIIHLIAPTAADYRDVMVNGDSGIRAVSPPDERPTFYSSRRQLEWPNGAIALCFSGEDPESLRGPQCYKLWADEIAAWQYPQETWDMALFGLRLGDPQACITSTPKSIQTVKQLVNDPDCVVTGGSTYENLANLGPTYRTIISRHEGTRLGRQEIHAELLDDEGLAYRTAAVHRQRPRHAGAARAAAGRPARGGRQAAPRRGRRSRLGTQERPRARRAPLRRQPCDPAVETAEGPGRARTGRRSAGAPRRTFRTRREATQQACHGQEVVAQRVTRPGG